MSPEDARRTVAGNIKRAARRRKMSLNRLADFSALNRPHLLRVASGKADATVGWLAQLADCLGVELAALFDAAVLRTKDAPQSGELRPGSRKGQRSAPHNRARRQ